MRRLESSAGRRCVIRSRPEDDNVIEGIPHNRFLVTVLQAMGLEPGDYESEGQAGYGATNTDGKDPNLWPVNYDFGQVGEILPGIRG
jgi:hypothetical protein